MLWGITTKLHGEFVETYICQFSMFWSSRRVNLGVLGHFGSNGDLYFLIWAHQKIWRKMMYGWNIKYAYLKVVTNVTSSHSFFGAFIEGVWAWRRPCRGFLTFKSLLQQLLLAVFNYYLFLSLCLVEERFLFFLQCGIEVSICSCMLISRWSTASL